MDNLIGKQEMGRHFRLLSNNCPSHDLDTMTGCPKCNAIDELIRKCGPEVGPLTVEAHNVGKGGQVRHPWIIRMMDCFGPHVSGYTEGFKNDLTKWGHKPRDRRKWETESEYSLEIMIEHLKVATNRLLDAKIEDAKRRGK